MRIRNLIPSSVFGTQPEIKPSINIPLYYMESDTLQILSCAPCGLSGQVCAEHLLCTMPKVKNTVAQCRKNCEIVPRTMETFRGGLKSLLQGVTF